MTPKERWLAAVRHKGVDRLPTDYWGTAEMTGKLLKALGLPDEEALWKELHIDRAHYAWADLNDPGAGGRGGADVWGLKYRNIEYAGGAGSYAEAANAPLASAETVADVEAYPWPDPAWWNAGGVKAQCDALGPWPVFGGSYEPFLLYCNLRGIEQAMEDLAANPEIVDAAMERLFNIHHAVIEKTLKAGAGAIDFVYVAEDFGTQESLLMSLGTFRRFFKPRISRIIELAHRYGAFAFHHDDGAIRSLIPDLLDCGIDVLNPVQWRCKGMDRAELKAEFGGRIAFHGAMDNQATLPFGTPGDVRREVRENAMLLGGGGGYILAPCHNLQVITPVENVVAMYEEVHRL